VISRRTIAWFVAFVVLAVGSWARFHWEEARCTEYVQQVERHGYGEVASSASNAGTVTIDTSFLCQPGELEPWWARCIILGAFASFIATIVVLIRDVWIWSRRKRVLS
jgi:hypothetical protein